MMFTSRFVDDPSFSDEDWKAYYGLIEELHRKYKSGFARTSWQQFRERQLSFFKIEKHYHRFVICDSDKIVGWADLQVQHHGTPDQAAYFSLDADYDNMPIEFACTVASELAALLEKYDCRSAFFMSTNKRTSQVPQAWGSKELNRVDRYRLYRDKANVPIMEEWLDTIPHRHPELHMEFYKSVPEEYLERYARLFELFINDMPKEREVDTPFTMDLDMLRRQIEWRRKNNMHLYTYALFGPNDRMIAHSNGFLNGLDPTDVYQAITGVDREYRGRGLSKWLKAALFRKIGEDFPDNEMMTTDMRAVNEPIQAVNRQMGYVLESRGHEFEVSPKDLRDFLAD